MYSYLVVFIGAGLGGAGRHAVNELAARCCGVLFPWGTLMVNVLGSLLMGALISYFALRGEGHQQQLRLFLATGILGGFTTFSAFSLEIVTLYERGNVAQAAGYAAISVALSLAAVFAGMWLLRIRSLG